MRAVLDALTRDIPKNVHEMKELVSVLTRTAYVQARPLGIGYAWEDVVMEAADLAIDALSPKASPEPRPALQPPLSREDTDGPA